jgi:hypothetical protein
MWLSGLGDQNLFEVEDLFVSQALSYAPVCADDINSTQVKLRHGM